MTKSRTLPIAIPSLAIAIAMAFFLLKPGSSQPPSRINPVFTVSPDTLPTGETSSVLACVHNGSPTSNRNIGTGDVFGFTFGTPCATGLTFDPAAVVNSANFTDANFMVGFGAVDEVTLTYAGAAVPFSPGDSFCAVVSFDAPAANSACTVESSSPSSGNYNALTPDFNLISVVDFAPGGGGGIPTGTIVLSDAAGGCPAEFVEVTAYEDRFPRFVRTGFAPGTTGGTTSHSHGAGSYITGAHTHGVGTVGGATDRRFVDDNSGGDDHFVSGENHTHSATIDPVAAGAVAGTSASEFHIPPFVMLRFCQKT